jgi:glutamate carboxypeptidase
LQIIYNNDCLIKKGFTSTTKENRIKNMSDNQSIEIFKFIQNKQDEMVSFISKLVSTESPSTVPESQELVFSLIKDELAGVQYEIDFIPGKLSGGHLHATPVNSYGDQVQLLIGHCDTVWPLGTLENMPLRVNENTMHGPGVFDMKAGLAQMLFALKAIRELNLVPTVSPEIFINSDEELGSPESTPHIQRLARNACRVLVLEPSLGPTGKIKTGRKGVGKFTIDIMGKAAHAGLDPERGISAILELSFIIQKLFALNDHQKGVTVNVGVVQGGVRPNVIASNSKAQVDVRVPTIEDAKRIESEILGIQPENPGVELNISGSVSRLPMVPTPGNRALWYLARNLGEKIGLDLEEGFAGGGSDGNTTSLITATLDGLGAVGDGAHAVHEFIYIDKLVERTALLALLLMAPPVD